MRWKGKMKKTVFTLLCVTNITIMIGYGIFIPLIPKMISTYNISITTASLTLSMYGLGQFLASPIIGSFSDDIGAKKTLIYGMIGYFITTIACLFQSKIVFIILLRFLCGLFAGTGGVCVTNYVSKYSSKTEQATYFTYISLAIGIGMTFGPLVGILYLYNRDLITIVLLGCGVILILAIYRFVPRDEYSENTQQTNLKSLYHDIKFASNTKINKFVLVTSFLFGLICSGLEAIVLAYILVYFKFTIENLIIVIICTLPMIIYVLYFSPKLISKHDGYFFSKNLLYMIAFGFILFSITKFDFLMVIGMAIVIAAMASLITTLTTVITNENKRPGLMLGARNSTMSIGAVFGPLIISWLYTINPHVAIIGFAVITLIVINYGMRIMEVEKDV